MRQGENQLKIIDNEFPRNMRVLLRVDFNVPIDAKGNILDSQRITNHLATIRFLKKKEARIILVAHLGKPQGSPAPQLSFLPLLPEIEELLQEKIILQKLEEYQPQSGITLLENIRFYSGEEKNDSVFSKQLAQLADIYVNDAFSVSHRTHSSVVGITQFLPSYAGFAFAHEYNSLSYILHQPKPPVLLIIGGKKVSDKLAVLKHLLSKVDHVLIGGAAANTFYQALGKNVKQSYTEDAMFPICRQLYQEHKDKIVLPLDFNEDHNQYLDIGKQTQLLFAHLIEKARTVVWAGPMGKCEDIHFQDGTLAILEAIAKPGIMSIVGGGETLAAIQNHPLSTKITFTSLGGGAMLEFLAKETLPGIEALMKAEGRGQKY
ncbi:MAG: phosphoglycerate kinase [Candidatus Abawacabacteria bacterium]|nr:phosphoglycerate kinase [Candidatus Abawacabacteria bacterium]